MSKDWEESGDKHPVHLGSHLLTKPWLASHSSVTSSRLRSWPSVAPKRQATFPNRFGPKIFVACTRIRVKTSIFLKYIYTQGDPRWRRSKWKLHLRSPRTNMELQLNYRKIILNNQLNISWREAL